MAVWKTEPKDDGGVEARRVSLLNLRTCKMGWGQQRMEPAIDFEVAGGIDVNRLERSLALKGNRVCHGRYHFCGGAPEHLGDLYTTQIPPLQCGGHFWRRKNCQHHPSAPDSDGNTRTGL